MYSMLFRPSSPPADSAIVLNTANKTTNSVFQPATSEPGCSYKRIPPSETTIGTAKILGDHEVKHKQPLNYIVTGAARGLGYELGKSIAQSDSGNHVTLTYRNEQKPENLQKLEAQHPNQVECLRLDLDNQESVATFANHYKEQHGRADVLCSCAAVYTPGGAKNNTLRLLKHHPEAMCKSFTSNCFGHFLLTSHLMAERSSPLASPSSSSLSAQRTHVSDEKEGVQKFILIGSGGSRFSEDNPKLPRMGFTYASSKAGLHMGVLKGGQEEQDNPSLIITTIDPGWMDTDMGGAGAPKGSTERAAQNITRLIPTLTKEASGKLLDAVGNVMKY